MSPRVKKIHEKGDPDPKNCLALKNEGKLSRLSCRLVDKRNLFSFDQLLARVQELYPVNLSIRREVDVHLLADLDGLDAAGFPAEANVGDVISRILYRAHRQRNKPRCAYVHKAEPDNNIQKRMSSRISAVRTWLEIPDPFLSSAELPEKDRGL